MARYWRQPLFGPYGILGTPGWDPQVLFELHNMIPGERVPAEDPDGIHPDPRGANDGAFAAMLQEAAEEAD